MATRRAGAPGLAIQAYLKRHGISQKAFGDSLGVSQALVSSWITGATQVTPKLAKQIEEKHGIPRLSLLYPEERAA